MNTSVNLNQHSKINSVKVNKHYNNKASFWAKILKVDTLNFDISKNTDWDIDS